MISPFVVSSVWLLAMLAAVAHAARPLARPLDMAWLVFPYALVFLLSRWVTPQPGWIAFLVALGAVWRLVRPGLANTDRALGGVCAALAGALHMGAGVAPWLAGVIPLAVLLAAGLPVRGAPLGAALGGPALILAAVAAPLIGLAPEVAAGWKAAQHLNQAAPAARGAVIPAWALAMAGLSLFAGALRGLLDQKMKLLDLLENGLFALGQVLRFPVMVLLWVCVALTLYYTGVSLVQAAGRRAGRAGYSLKAWLKAGDVLHADAARRAALPTNLRLMLTAIQAQDAIGALGDGGLENIVAEHEEKLRHSLDGPRSLVKLGPSLGLIGTLIPMGSSLAAMASGNLQAMAGQMVVAFTTTIIGLATGTVAYALVAMRQGWVSASIREQRYMAEVVAAEMERR